jgi:hypothetical protein
MPAITSAVTIRNMNQEAPIRIKSFVFTMKSPYLNGYQPNHPKFSLLRNFSFTLSIISNDAKAEITPVRGREWFFHRL